MHVCGMLESQSVITLRANYDSAKLLTVVDRSTNSRPPCAENQGRKVNIQQGTHVDIARNICNRHSPIGRRHG